MPCVGDVHGHDTPGPALDMRFGGDVPHEVTFADGVLTGGELSRPGLCGIPGPLQSGGGGFPDTPGDTGKDFVHAVERISADLVDADHAHSSIASSQTLSSPFSVVDLAT